MGNKAIDTMDQGGLPGTRRPQDQDFFTSFYPQVDIIQALLCLGFIFEGKIFKTEDRGTGDGTTPL
jgi:hypothetical protein